MRKNISDRPQHIGGCPAISEVVSIGEPLPLDGKGPSVARGADDNHRFSIGRSIGLS